MKEKIVRFFGWVSAVFYSIMALITCLILIYESLWFTAFLSLTIFIGMAITGWNARIFGLKNFEHKFIIKLTAIFSLIFGCVFATLSPFIFSKSYGIAYSFESIIVLIVMFLPSIISSLAILVKYKVQIN